MTGENTNVLIFPLQAAWMLLAEVSQFSVDMDSKFIYDNWQKYSDSVTMETVSPLVQVLVTIGNVARKLSRIAVEDIRGTKIARGPILCNSRCMSS